MIKPRIRIIIVIIMLAFATWLVVHHSLYSTSEAFSNDFAQLTLSQNNYIVGNIGGNLQSISVGISTNVKYIDREDIQLIQRFEQARRSGEIVAIWEKGLRKDGKTRIVKIGNPSYQEKKAFKEMMKNSLPG